MHHMRTETYSQNIFDELVIYDKKTAYVRHARSVRKVATAYCKLLFPHVKSLDNFTPEEFEAFKMLYLQYCLQPAIDARTYIYNQCKLIDREFKSYGMPQFIIMINANNEEDQVLEEDVREVVSPTEVNIYGAGEEDNA